VGSSSLGGSTAPLLFQFRFAPSWRRGKATCFTSKDKDITQYGACYELLDSKGEKVGTAYVEHRGPISRWSWFTYVNGDSASNGYPFETGEQAYEDLEETVKRHGLSVKQPAQGN
jgi:hypothetical protein